MTKILQIYFFWVKRLNCDKNTALLVYYYMQKCLKNVIIQSLNELIRWSIPQPAMVCQISLPQLKLFSKTLVTRFMTNQPTMANLYHFLVSGKRRYMYGINHLQPITRAYWYSDLWLNICLRAFNTNSSFSAVLNKGRQYLQLPVCLPVPRILFEMGSTLYNHESIKK